MLHNMGPVRSDQYDGKMRWLWPSTCEVCGGTFLVPKAHLGERTTCSIKCRGLKHRNRVMLRCATCGREFDRRASALSKSRSGLTFCSRVCKDSAQRIEGFQVLHPSHYGDGSGSYRERALRSHGAICARCGYDESIQMLDAHHRNREGSTKEDLEVLCVWCHALETRGVAPHAWKGTVAQRESTRLAPER